MRANSAAREPEIQALWQEQRVYERIQERRAEAPSYILHDGPPYSSSGAIHIGHAMNKTLKDIVVKYKNLAGFRAPFVPGYDTHGLPTELAALKELKAKHQDLAPLEVRRLSRQFALKSIESQKGHFMRLGGFGDWENPYVTMDPAFEAQQIRVFGQMAHKGYIYKGLKPVYWCSFDTTALAEAEVEYADHVSPSIFVRFALKSAPASATLVGELLAKGDRPVSMAIWTTTPWTLPANLAIAVGPEIDYVVLDSAEHGYLVVAEDLVDAFLADTALSATRVGESFKGALLEGARYRHVFLDRESPVILGDHVTTETGSGAVHTAPGHGVEDYEVGQKYGLDVLAPLNDRGIFLEEAGPLVAGQHYSKANAVIIEELGRLGVLLGHKDLGHSYPHCWRCKHPVIFRATEQWFASIDGFRQAALDAIKGVQWVPSFGEVRISNMIADRSDWCISRQRSWGVPIPVFYCQADNEPLLTPESIEAVASRFAVEGADAWWVHDAKALLPEGTACARCGGHDFRKETDIMDVWFDSGSSWSAVLEARPELNFPADLYLEGADQYRGWFQSSLLTAIATRGVAPYKTVLTHGFTMDGQGRKMSKSLGNMVEPIEVIKHYGADVLRLYVSSVDYTGDVRISELILKQLSEVYRKIRNTARYLISNLSDFDPARHAVPVDQLTELDRYALHRLQEVIAEVTQAFDRFEFYRFYQVIQNYCVVDLSSFYLDVVKDRLYASAPSAHDRRSTQTVLCEILKALTLMISPVLSHLAEDIHQNLSPAIKGDAPSVFLLDWPKAEAAKMDEALAKRYGALIPLREAVNKALEEARKEKLIGTSLAASVTLVPRTEQVHDLLVGLGESLPKLLIVSHVTVAPASDQLEAEGDLGVTVQAAPGAKCERCWTFSLTVGESPAHPTLCSRCVGVMNDLVGV
ncbi:MAG TPA: isoleucine--tRNA ligase [Pantanalinema sp.]